jgi:uncharacterized membrane protein YjjP (DUF1212 family)
LKTFEQIQKDVENESQHFLLRYFRMGWVLVAALAAIFLAPHIKVIHWQSALIKFGWGMLGAYLGYVIWRAVMRGQSVSTIESSAERCTTRLAQAIWMGAFTIAITSAFG